MVVCWQQNGEVLAMSERFRPTDIDGFYGDSVYGRVVPANHFLRHLKRLIDWEALCQDFARFYKGGAEYGPAPIKPSLLMKMLFLSYLYNLSERQTEELVNFNLAAKYFVGLAVDEVAPDHSTLTVFKRRLSEQWQTTAAFERVLLEVVQTARDLGVNFGKLQLVDSSHTIADVDLDKDKERRGGGQAPRDPDAKWGNKGKRKVKDPDGSARVVNKYFYGYKQHVSVNAESALVTAVVHTTGEATDGKQLRQLVEKDEAAGVRGEVYAGDKGYDDGDNHAYLEHTGRQSALALNGYRTRKKDGNKQKWLQMRESVGYQGGQKERYRVEQKIAEGRRHGSKRCRYLGLVRYGIQGFLTVIVLNAKRLLKLLTATHDERVLALA
jgi:IS5 family transposase